MKTDEQGLMEQYHGGYDIPGRSYKECKAIVDGPREIKNHYNALLAALSLLISCPDYFGGEDELKERILDLLDDTSKEIRGRILQMTAKHAMLGFHRFNDHLDGLTLGKYVYNSLADNENEKNVAQLNVSFVTGMHAYIPLEDYFRAYLRGETIHAEDLFNVEVVGPNKKDKIVTLREDPKYPLVTVDMKALRKKTQEWYNTTKQRRSY